MDEINGIDFDDEEVPNRRDVRQDPQVLEFANLFPRLIALDPHDAQLANQNLARMARHLAPENYIRVARREQRRELNLNEGVQYQCLTFQNHSCAGFARVASTMLHFLTTWIPALQAKEHAKLW